MHGSPGAGEVLVNILNYSSRAFDNGNSCQWQVRSPGVPAMNDDKDDPQPTAEDETRAREAGLDDTIAQSFPASDPASTIPNPCEPQLLDSSKGPSDDSGDPR